MYITKSGVIQKIDEDAWPLWRDLGWGIDQDRDGTPDSLSGGGDTSGLLPIADPTGVTTVQVDNPITGEPDGMKILVVPAETPIFAVKIEGDAFPRLVLSADPNDWGVFFIGDGAHDPFDSSVSPAISLSVLNSGQPAIGMTAIAAGAGQIVNDLEFPNTGRGCVYRAPNGSRHRVVVANDGTLSTEVVT